MVFWGHPQTAVGALQIRKATREDLLFFGLDTIRSETKLGASGRKSVLDISSRSS